MNFIDTADVYGDGRSERLIARLKKERKEEIIVATKAGRKLPKQTAEGYSRENLTRWVDDSLRNLAADAWTCCNCTVRRQTSTTAPRSSASSTTSYERENALLRRERGARGRGLKAIEFPNVQTVQIIFNCFRTRPAELFFPEAQAKAGGNTCARAAGERNADRQDPPRIAVCGRRSPQLQSSRRKFDVGETFSGVDYEQGLAAAEEFRGLFPPGTTLAQLALRWILMFDAVKCAIPGGKRPDQVQENCRASDLPAIGRGAWPRSSESTTRRFAPACINAGRPLPSAAENRLNGFGGDGQVARVAGERTKTVLPVECRGAVVDRFHLDRSKSDLAGDAEAALKGVE